MKSTRSLTVAAMLALSTSLGAQFSITPNLGISYTSLTNTGEVGECTYYLYEKGFQSPKLTVGLLLSLPVSEHFEVGLDINYNSGKVESAYDFYKCADDAGFIWMRYEYIHVNPKLIYRHRSGFEFIGGIYGSLNTNAVSNEITIGGETKLDFDRWITSRDWGGQAGLGYYWNGLSIRIEYLHGLREFLDEDRLSWLRTVIGYKFEIRKKGLTDDGGRL